MKIFAKKSLGQNFLKSKATLNDIVEAGEIRPEDFVVEIGPGKGALTEKILATDATVLAIEKDFRLLELLTEKFSKEIKEGKLEILEEDILKFDLEKLPIKYKLIANIPYYITGQIFEKFLSADNQPELAVFMIQKEVCDRIIARNNKESLLSISVKAYAEPKYIKKVPARYFSPSPKVDSAIIKLSNISKQNFETSRAFEGDSEPEKDFFKLIKAGFAHKRKVLISNLKEWAKEKWPEIETENKSSQEKLRKKFQQARLDPKIRAEKLSVQDWINLLN